MWSGLHSTEHKVYNILNSWSTSSLCVPSQHEHQSTFQWVRLVEPYFSMTSFNVVHAVRLGLCCNNVSHVRSYRPWPRRCRQTAVAMASQARVRWRRAGGRWLPLSAWGVTWRSGMRTACRCWTAPSASSAARRRSSGTCPSPARNSSSSTSHPITAWRTGA